MIPSTVLIALMGAISAYTFGLIGRVSRATNTISYSDAWDETVGKKSSFIIAFSCFIDCFFGNLSYSMILADTMVNLLASAGIAVTRTQSLLGVTGIVLLPLCLMKNLASLAPFSLIGITGMLYTTFAMVARYIGGSYASGGKFLATALTAPVFSLFQDRYLEKVWPRNTSPKPHSICPFNRFMIVCSSGCRPSIEQISIADWTSLK